MSVEKSGSIITNFDANDLLYIYTGENIFTFILGQTGPDFNLYYSNYMIPTTFSGITTWALILFNYTEPPSSPIQEAILVIIASNKLDEGSITLYFNPISRGSYVLLNELYDTKSNILTSGEFVKVIEQEFTTAVPVSAFYGNNINFYLVHKNGTTIQSVGQCDSLQPICILGKTSLDYYLDFQNVQLEAFDMTENNGVLYASIENMILAYDMKSSPYSLLQIYNLTNINGAYSTSCHRIQAVPNVTDVLIVSCNYFPLQTSSYYFTYLAALDLNNLSNNNLIPASYLSIIIEVILDEGMVTVYVHDRQDIKVYELTGFNVKYLLVQYAEIDPEFFGLDTFYINSIMYINHTDLLLIEENTGFIWLKQDRVNNGISFLLYAQIAVTSLVADYPFVKLISAVLLSDKSTILANDVKGNNYYLLLRDGSVIDVYNTIPSINSEYNM